MLPPAFFDRSVHDVARDLIGCTVAHGETAGVIWDESATTATGKAWENHGVDVIRVHGAKIVSLHENNDVNLVYEHFPRYDPDAA